MSQDQMLVPPPAIDPDAPMIARTEQVVVDRPPGEVFAYVVGGPLERMIPVTRRLPGVSGTTLLTSGPWGVVGQRRHVHLTDGSRTTEQVLECEPGQRFRYEVWDYSTSAARPIAYALGDFRFEAAGVGERTDLIWTYAFRLRPDIFPGVLGGLGRGLMRLAFIDTAYAELMCASLAAMKREIETAG
ncbi:MAG: SRPBCC family protein [Proteobacteria bacterium]|nr:SRPBCC family protein [Pseudomonadota bacterium]